MKNFIKMMERKRHFQWIVPENIEKLEARLFSEALPTLYPKNTSNLLIKNFYCALVKSKRLERLMKFR